LPRQVQQHGRDTAFFATNCGMQEPLIRAALDQKAIMPEQCCPSPTHGYPGALGIAISEEEAGDMAAIRAAISAKVTEADNNGRMATWPISVGIVGIEALVEVAIEALDQGADVTSAELLTQELQKAAEGAEVVLVPFEDKDNFYMFLFESVVF
jgi:hypothetical protein